MSPDVTVDRRVKERLTQPLGFPEYLPRGGDDLVDPAAEEFELAHRPNYNPPPSRSNVTFDTYKDARAFAEAQTRALKQPHGIERMPNPLKGKDATCFSVKMLPGKAHRAGWELRCEAIEVDDQTNGENTEFYEWLQSQARKRGYKDEHPHEHPRLRALSAAAWMAGAESCEKDAQPALRMSAHCLFTLLRDTWAEGLKHR